MTSRLSEWMTGSVLYFRENYRTVLRALIHASLSLTVVAISYGQRTYTLQGAVRNKAQLDLGNDHTLQVCTHDIVSFEDSSYCELVWTQQGQVVINARRFRIIPYYSPFIGFACDIAQLNDGFILGGGRCSSGPEALPFLMKVAQNGDLEWSGSLAPLPIEQVAMKRVFAAGDTFTAYTSYTSDIEGCGYSPGNQIYRIKGESTGTVWEGLLISTTPYNINVLDAMDGGDHHLLCGVGFIGGEEKAMLMSVSDSGATWINYYDISANDNVQLNGTPDLERTADGGFVIVGSTAHDGVVSSMVIKLDPFGTVIWSAELDHVNGFLALGGVHELPGGDLLIAGYATPGGPDHEGIVIRLSGLGSIVWQKSFEVVAYYGPLLADFSVNDAGEIKLLMDLNVVELDSTGAGCGFTDISAISATPFSPSVTSIPFTNSSVPLSLVPETFPARTPTASWSVYCDPVGMDELPERIRLVANPVPSSDIVRLGKPGEVAANERVIIRDITGALRGVLSYGTALDLRIFSSGVYFCELPRTGQRVRIVKE